MAKIIVVQFVVSIIICFIFDLIKEGQKDLKHKWVLTKESSTIIFSSNYLDNAIFAQVEKLSAEGWRLLKGPKPPIKPTCNTAEVINENDSPIPKSYMCEAKGCNATRSCFRYCHNHHQLICIEGRFHSVM